MYAGLEDVVETLPEFLQTDTPDAHALRQAIAHLIGMGVQADIHLVHGTPEHELLRAARNQDVGLLVIGSAWAAQPVSRLLLRNMTKQVLLNTHQPVLVIRSCDS
jgi:nucleotide-binding universal stress UspA family protein